jgi:hypothetical protein
MAECRTLGPLLDEYVDGTLDDVRARAVRGHLRGCAACAGRVAAIQQLVDAAGGLGELDPPSELWARIDARLDAEERQDGDRPRLWWWWQAWGRRVGFAVGAAATALAAAVLFAVRTQATVPLADALRPLLPKASPEALYDDAVREVARAQTEYQTAVDELRGAAQGERARWRPSVQKAFDDNLAAIDAAVARQAEAARARPGDVAAADALAESYRKEIDFLQEAVVRGEVP